MVSYYCYFVNDNYVILMAVDTDDKIKAINMIFDKLIQIGIDKDFSYRYVKENVKLLKKDSVIFLYLKKT